MKPTIKLLSALALLGGLLAVPGIAQRKTVQKDTPRGLFTTKHADAMNVVIFKLEGEQLIPVDPGREFKQGDQIKLEFQSNFDGYIYFVNIQPSGKRRVIFPYAGAADNSVKADQRYQIPPAGDVIEFDAEKGTEVLQVIMSKERVNAFDAAIKDSDGWLGETASSAAAELQGGITNQNVTPAIPAQDRDKIRSRDIILQPGQDKNKQGSYVAIPDKGGSGGRLKPGEIAPFEIRLKHT